MARTAFLSSIALSSGLFALSAEIRADGQGQSPYFTITDLGTLPDAAVSYAADINDQGQIVGFCIGYPDEGDSSPAVASRAFLWEDGTMLDLGMPEEVPTEPPSDWSAYVQPWAVNNAGQVLVSYSGFDGATRSFVWKNGAMWELTVEPGAPQFYPYAISDLGDIFGVIYGDGGQTYAAGWQDGAPYPLPGIEGYASSWIWGANNAGQMAGTVTTRPADAENPVYRGFLWDNGSITLLDTLGGGNGCAYAINEQGQVIGESDLADGQSHAVLWQDGQITDLGTLEGFPFSEAYDINSSGQVVGVAFTHEAGPDDDSATPWGAVASFLWLPGPAYGLPAGMHNLNDLIAPDSGWLIEYVSTINDSGWIAATASSGTDTRAVLLTPPADAADAEPTGLCGTGLFGLFPSLLLAMAWLRIAARGVR